MEKKVAKAKGKAKAKKAIRPSGKPSIRKTSPKKAKKESLVQAFGLHKLVIPRGAHKKRKIKGRGPGSGHGKTSTRGSKGQTSRAGRHFYLGFEGGTSPLIRRIPKRGFVPISRKVYQILNLKDLAKIKEPLISLEFMEAKGLIKDKLGLVKILGDGELKNAVTVQAHAFSKKAAEAIAKAGGKAEIINA